MRMLQRVEPQAKAIVFMHPREEPRIGELLELFPINAVLAHPVTETALQAARQSPAQIRPSAGTVTPAVAPTAPPRAAARPAPGPAPDRWPWPPRAMAALASLGPSL